MKFKDFSIKQLVIDKLQQWQLSLFKLSERRAKKRAAKGDKLLTKRSIFALLPRKKS